MPIDTGANRKPAKAITAGALTPLSKVSRMTLFLRATRSPATRFACIALLGLLPLRAVAEPTAPRLDTDRMVELARVCLEIRELDPVQMSERVEEHGLTPSTNALPLMTRYFAQRQRLLEWHYDRKHNADPAETARQILYPMGDPVPLMAFEDAGGWLFLVGQDATVWIERNLKTGASVRHTAYTCHIFGDGYIPDGEARAVLAAVLGDGFGGYHTTPQHAVGSPHTMAKGGFDFAPPRVEANIFSLQGNAEDAPISHMDLTAETGRAD